MDGLIGASRQASATPDSTEALVKDTDLQHFMKDVMQASTQRPVLAYFWSPHSPLSKEFESLLVRYVNAAAGKVHMVRINIEAHPQIASQFRVQTVPTTYLFLQGQPVDGFAGPLGEAQVKELFQKLTGEEAGDVSHEDILKQAQSLFDAGEIEQSLALFQALHQEMPEHHEALAGFARCLIVLERLAEAKALLATLPNAQDAAITGARAALALAESGAGKLDIAALEKAVTKNPADHHARYDFARALFVAGKQEEAVAELLTIIGKDREWEEQKARKELLTFFEAMGNTHKLTLQGRRKLSSLLFS